MSASDKIGTTADILPEVLGIYAFNVAFFKESKEWEVVSSAWERLGEAPPRKSVILNLFNNALKWYHFYAIIASRYESFSGVADQIC